jgi:hypothetical protein
LKHSGEIINTFLKFQVYPEIPFFLIPEISKLILKFLKKIENSQ